MLIGQQSDVGPAIAFVPQLNSLVFAWRGRGNNALNVAFSSTSNVSALGAVWTSAEVTSDTPSITVASNGVIYIAWKGHGNSDLSLAKLVIDTAHPGVPTATGITEKTSFLSVSDSFPSLNIFDHIYVSFRGAGTDHITFITADTNPPDVLTVSNETTALTPVMMACANNIDARGVFIGWVGTGNNSLNMLLLSGGSFYWGGDQRRYTSTNTSPSAFSIAYIPDRMYLAWRGSGNNQLNVMREDNWLTNSANTLPDTTDASPAICAYRNLDGVYYLALAWKGMGNADLNVQILNQNLGIVAHSENQWSNVKKAALPQSKIKVWPDAPTQ